MTQSHPPNSESDSWLDRNDNRQRHHWGRRPSRRERNREAVMRDWFGPDRGPGEIAERRRDPAPIADLLEEAIGRVRGPRGACLERIVQKWSEIAGADLAKVTTPCGLRNKRLLIEVSHPAWLYVLEREHKAVLAERVRSAAPDEISDIQFVQKGRRPAAQ